MTEIRLAATPADVARARRFVRDELGATVPSSMLADAQLVVSELVTNAIEHGDVDEIVVGAAGDADAVRICVTTGSPPERLGAIADWAIAQRDERAGRGLGIVRELADELAIVTVDGEAHVHVTIHLARSISVEPSVSSRAARG